MAAPAISLRRKIFFAALLTLVMLAVVLGVLEGGLRLAGYGYSPHFARRATLPDGSEVWRENRWVTAPFFSAALVRRPQAFRLPVKKDPGAYRIFVLGSSAAMGDPEASFSLSRMLETMLHGAWPERRFEVVNAGITAINSHLVRDIAADCAQMQPDLFIVYEGNNEVIGPFGPAGVFAPFVRSETAVRTAGWIKGTRTGQLISGVGRPATRTGKAGTEWGGMKMFLAQQIAADDPRLDAVRAHFRTNLLAIAATARRVGASTLLCTVATNQRDFPPFVSLHRTGLSASELARWQESFSAGEDAARAGDTGGAEKNFRAALAIDDRHAETQFRLGRILLQGGERDAEARTLLQRAQDLDALRFRTDSSLNQIVRDLAREKLPGLEVVDLAAALDARSPHGICGDEFLYEHVHLTFRGTYEVAREIFAHVGQDMLRRGFVSGSMPAPLDYDAARARLGFTTYEQAMIAGEMLNRMRGAPFDAQSDHAARVQAWERRVAAASALLAREDALPAMREIYERALADAPGDWILARNAAMMLVARGLPGDALPLLERALAWIDDDVDTLIALGLAHRALGNSTDAEKFFGLARALEPRHPNLPR